MSEDYAGRLRVVAASLGPASGAEATIAGVCGYLLGAAYGLLRAVELGFVRGNTVTPEYFNELREVAEAIAAGVDPSSVSGTRIVEGKEHTGDHIWVAGFYFNSGLHRLAAAADRMRARQKHDASVPDAVEQLYREVNKLKHDAEGLVPLRLVYMADAVTVLEYLTRRFLAAGEQA